MPICGHCQIGFEADEKCPSCQCPSGTWKSKWRRPSLIQELPNIAIFICAVILHLFVSFVSFFFAAAFGWSGAPDYILVPFACMFVALNWPILTVFLLTGGVVEADWDPGIVPLVCLSNSVIWTLGTLGLLQIYHTIRVRIARP